MVCLVFGSDIWEGSTRVNACREPLEMVREVQNFLRSL